MEEIIKSTQELVRIPSKQGEPSLGAPFGEDVTKAIEASLAIGKKYGMETRNMDGYIGLIDYGEGEEVLGIMCHVDVVPEGTGWKHPPYEAVIEDGILYGRGTLDDKGPAVSAIYALAAIKECGLKMKRKVRIMLGGNEESGWGCMKHYGEHEKMPDLAFSPDADYPLVNSEKGIAHATYACEYPSSISLKGGTAGNVICGKVEAELVGNFESISKIVEAFAEKTGFNCSVDKNGDKVGIRVIGVEGHASTPHVGKNALQGMLCLLREIELQPQDASIIAALNDALKMDMHGESVGIDSSDESGRTTMTPSIIDWNENGFNLTVDMRIPISVELNSVINKLNDAFGVTNVVHTSLQPGHFVSRDSELVSKLLEVYANRTGEYLEPLAIGGGTYARAVPNAVAFGCERPGVPALIHMPNESIRLEDIDFNTRMIADAIIALACEE